jgi:hypothetical protein
MSIATVIDGICPQFPPNGGNVGDALVLQPDRSVNWGSLSGYVPYTGATADVNLGAFELTAANISNVNTGDQVFIQETEPTVTAPSLWVQTGLGCKGTGFSLWYIQE